ncbi:unnamed protein product [Polarella glacialis]|uniref:Uncharacterized protein n=1 Tax=Polarella glacialis TaxID=89957 RepID=A0A813JFJ4_POLGL|nr:unnamed protein product [Polarella glacialis]
MQRSQQRRRRLQQGIRGRFSMKMKTLQAHLQILILQRPSMPLLCMMPQGWLAGHVTGPGWTDAKLEQVESLTKHVLQEYRGDPAKVVLSGQSMSDAVAWNFAAMRPGLWLAMNVICGPTTPSVAAQLEVEPVWVVGWTGDGESGNDEVVGA